MFLKACGLSNVGLVTQPSQLDPRAGARRRTLAPVLDRDASVFKYMISFNSRNKRSVGY